MLGLVLYVCLVHVPDPAAPRLPVGGLTDVVDLSVGGQHACVVRRGGEVWCWGDNDYGQIGDPGLEVVTKPVRVRGVVDVRQVAAGAGMSCAVERDGEAWCWGGYRALATDPHGMDWPIEKGPTRVAAALSGTVEVAVGWGLVTLRDSSGALTLWQHYEGPFVLTDWALAAQLSSTDMGMCARAASGRVQCMTTTESEGSGSGGRDGSGYDPGDVVAPVVWTSALRALLTIPDQDGDDYYSSQAPCQPSGADAPPTLPWLCASRLGGVIDIDGQGAFTCAVLASGHVACWGCPECWQEPEPPPTGLPPRALASMPILIAGLDRVSHVAVGRTHACVLRGGEVWCWGDNFEGQLGVSGVESSAAPVHVERVGDVVELDAGEAATCALRRDGTVTCWGRRFGAPPREPSVADHEWIPSPPTFRDPPAAEGPEGERLCADFDVMYREEPTDKRYRYDDEGMRTPPIEGEAWRWTRDGLVEEGTRPDGYVKIVRDRFGNALSRRERDRRSTWTIVATVVDGRVVSERETLYADDIWQTPKEIVERLFTYDARGRRARTDELFELGSEWIAWRSTVHIYRGCD